MRFDYMGANTGFVLGKKQLIGLKGGTTRTLLKGSAGNSNQMPPKNAMRKISTNAVLEKPVRTSNGVVNNEATTVMSKRKIITGNSKR